MARHDSSSDDDDSSAPRKRPRLDSASDGDDSHARRRARKAERKAAKRAKKAEKKERKRAKKAARRRDGADEPGRRRAARAAAGARARALAATGPAQEGGPRGLLRLAPRGREREGARRHVPRDGQVQGGARGRERPLRRLGLHEVPLHELQGVPHVRAVPLAAALRGPQPGLGLLPVVNLFCR